MSFQLNRPRSHQVGLEAGRSPPEAGPGSGHMWGGNMPTTRHLGLCALQLETHKSHIHHTQTHTPHTHHTDRHTHTPHRYTHTHTYHTQTTHATHTQTTRTQYIYIAHTHTTHRHTHTQTDTMETHYTRTHSMHTTHTGPVGSPGDLGLSPCPRSHNTDQRPAFCTAAPKPGAPRAVTQPQGRWPWARSQWMTHPGWLCPQELPGPQRESPAPRKTLPKGRRAEEGWQLHSQVHGRREG